MFGNILTYHALEIYDTQCCYWQMHYCRQLELTTETTRTLITLSLCIYEL